MASSVRGLLAEIRRHTASNIVAIKSTVEHDASGIRDTMEEETVSLMSKTSVKVL